MLTIVGKTIRSKIKYHNNICSMQHYVIHVMLCLLTEASLHHSPGLFGGYAKYGESSNLKMLPAEAITTLQSQLQVQIRGRLIRTAGAAALFDNNSTSTSTSTAPVYFPGMLPTQEVMVVLF